MNEDTWYKAADIFIAPVVVGLIVGYGVWQLGRRSIQRDLQATAIRDLMAYRGDYSSTDFSRALNKVSIIFHKDKAIRKEIRELYEAINNSLPQASINRKIVGLIYNLCQKNGYKGITEYDIDQSFPEARQTPVGEDSSAQTSSSPISVTPGTPVGNNPTTTPAQAGAAPENQS